MDSAKPAASDQPSPWGQGALRLGLAYLALYLLLDWVSFIWPLGDLNVTPWNPQPGLALALLLWRPRWWWLVASGLLLAEVGVRGRPENWGLAVTVSLVMAAAYSAVAWVLRRWVLHTPALATRTELSKFTAVVLAAAALHALLYVSLYAQGSRELSGQTLPALLRYWVGDAVGILVLLPGLLLLTDPQRRQALRLTAQDRTFWLTATLIVALVMLVFVLERRHQINLYFLLLLPVVWSASRGGLAGAALASGVTQIGLIAAGVLAPAVGLGLLEMQGLMAAITMAGLALGVTVDEQQRADARWRAGARMAAAGQMTASIAHELGQPLTALAGYARACSMLALAPDARLQTVAQHIEREALRAGEIIQRLRSFFTQGLSQRQWVALQPLLAEALQQAEPRAAHLGVSLRLLPDEDSPRLWLDAVQIGVVLRNLIDNALDAACASTQPGRTSLVQVQASAKEREVLVEVIDSGAGIAPDRLARLFEPAPSDKPEGMGIGLSLCRAIVESHGGRLWAEPGPRGHLCMMLPLPSNPDAPPEPDHAS